MSKFKLEGVKANLGGHAVVITGEFEFVDEIADAEIETDTLAGALWVESPQNAAAFPQLAHGVEKEEDGEDVIYDVTYGLNAERVETRTETLAGINEKKAKK